MENNIFFKKKKDKFNPDVITSLSKKNSERRKSEFVASKTIYNAITNNVPTKISTAKDLLLKVDQPSDNIKRAMSDKLSERTKQESELKPTRLKSLPKDLPISSKNLLSVSDFLSADFRDSGVILTKLPPDNKLIILELDGIFSFSTVLLIHRKII